MAESTVAVEPRSQYFCHACNVYINPVLPEFLCPTCDGGFIEPMSPDDDVTSPNRTRPSDSSDGTGQQRRIPPANPQAGAELLEMLQFFMNSPEGGPGAPGRQRNPGGTVGSGARTPDGEQRPNLFVHVPRTSITFQNVGNQPIALMDLFNSLPGMAGAGGGGGGNFMFPLFNLHGNPQDYVWGEGGLDTIITQLLNNVEGQGPPPAQKDDIDGLQNVEISAEHIHDSSECPVCKEDFKLGDDAKRLPCEHLFHPDCVTTWLHMHNTCPVCRRPIGDSMETNQSTPPQFGGI